jgi:hypothetical protein
VNITSTASGVTQSCKVNLATGAAPTCS